MTARRFQTLDSADVSGKTVIVRADLNVPMRQGAVSDATRITRLTATLKELLKKKAKVVCLSHFDRPGGKFTPSMSLAPIADVLGKALGMPVRFAVDCVGAEAEKAVSDTKPGEIILLENLRFHAGEEANDPAFAKALAGLGDLYVNDAFSCSHRAHASVVGIAQHLPAFAGRLMQAELEALETILSAPKKPIAAVVGGAKISTKLALLENLIAKMDMLVIAGGMANTFLYAEGISVGKSLCETGMKKTAQEIMKKAKKAGCEILLPQDAVVTTRMEAHAPCSILPTHKNLPKEGIILDIGPRSVAHLCEKISTCKTVLWNGPLGMFETSPFDAGTVTLARMVAGLTQEGKLKSIAGGGDTAAALTHAGLAEGFTYLSTAGGAFLEWLEGKTLPGVEALYGKSKNTNGGSRKCA